MKSFLSVVPILAVLLVAACDKPKVVRRVDLVTRTDSSWAIVSTDGHQCTADVHQVPKVAPGDTIVCIWGPP